MLKDVALKYYDQDCNCAESILMGANEYYKLGLGEETFHAIGGMGGGCCSGRMCGACLGSVAAVSSEFIKTRAHAEPEARAHVKDLVEEFIAELGSDICSEIKAKYWDEETHCRKTIARAAEVLESKMDSFKA